ncbi:MAG: acetolactate synthase large subunit [Actinomycetota bacterium]
MSDAMTGGQAAIGVAFEAGIEVCFANAGTTEIHLVEALDRQPGIRSVLGLNEGICSGAADGYSRIAGKPALGLFHLGPGFANSAANQHNARRAFSPVVNLIGDQASWHMAADASLTSDIDAIAGWAGWVGRSTSADSVAAVVGEAIVQSTTGTRGVASAVLHADHQWESVTAPLPKVSFGGPSDFDAAAVPVGAEALRRPGAALIAMGPMISRASKAAMVAIREATGCAIWISRHASAEYGDGLVIPELPYFPEDLIAAAADISTAVLAGGSEPVCFFGYPGQRSNVLAGECEKVQLCHTEHDLDAVLQALVAEVGAVPPEPGAVPPVERPTGELTSATLGQALIACLPDDAIVTQEAITNRASMTPHMAGASRFTQLNLAGGAIGEGLPMAIGAAIAAPDRRVVAFQADGSSLYSIQSLWTMAREELDITIVLIDNRAYRIIEVEGMRAGLDPGTASRDLLELDRPHIDYALVAQGFGVPAAQATTADELVRLLDQANATPGPFFIQAVL